MRNQPSSISLKPLHQVLPNLRLMRVKALLVLPLLMDDETSQ